MTPSSPSADRHVRERLIAVIAVLLTIAALNLGRPVLMPFTVGLFIAMLAWPLQHRLQKRLPRWLSLLLAILAVILVLAALLAAIGWSAAAVIEQAQQRQGKIESLVSRAARWAGEFGVSVPWAEGMDDRTGAAADPAGGAGTGAGADTASPQEDAATADNDFLTSWAERVGRALFTGAGYIALALGFAALSLAELDDARRKIRDRFRPELAERMLAISARVSGSFRRYFAVKSLTSAITGAASGLFALLVGLDFAAVWALLAFLFEYVPTIGSILAVFPPSLWAFIQFDGIMKPIGVLAGFTALQLFLGNYVDPRIEGRFMYISPLIVLLSIVFWAWMWGPAGALLGVPLTVTVAVIARHFDRSRWVWALITEPKDEEKKENEDDDDDLASHDGEHRDGTRVTRA